MIVKLREAYIVRLEKLLKEPPGSFLAEEQDRLLSELRAEVQMLREQVSAWPGNPGGGRLGAHATCSSPRQARLLALLHIGAVLCLVPFFLTKAVAPEGNRRAPALLWPGPSACPLVGSCASDLSH